MSNELGVMAGVAEIDTIDADCIPVGRVTRMTSVNSIAQHIHSTNLHHHACLVSPFGSVPCARLNWGSFLSVFKHKFSQEPL